MNKLLLMEKSFLLAAFQTFYTTFGVIHFPQSLNSQICAQCKSNFYYCRRCLCRMWALHATLLCSVQPELSTNRNFNIWWALVYRLAYSWQLVQMKSYTVSSRRLEWFWHHILKHLLIFLQTLQIYLGRCCCCFDFEPNALPEAQGDYKKICVA